MLKTPWNHNVRRKYNFENVNKPQYGCESTRGVKGRVKKKKERECVKSGKVMEGRGW